MMLALALATIVTMPVMQSAWVDDDSNAGISVLDEPVVSRESTLDLALVRPKDPGWSGLLALMVPGAGQFYNEDYLKGGLVFFGSVALGVGTVVALTAFVRNHSLSGAPVNFADFTSLEKLTLIGLTGSLLSLWLASVVDAVLGAYRYNSRILDEPPIQLAWTGLGVALILRV